MTTHKLSELQVLIFAATPNTRSRVAAFCRHLGYIPSSVYRAINTLQRRGLVTIDESGTVRRAGE